LIGSPMIGNSRDAPLRWSSISIASFRIACLASVKHVHYGGGISVKR
jgi:hypothetical protein